ncbi:hypothetical protein [Methylophaga sp.]|uniref:hypothetical protein n=1 Tax=Methylophaga sp. TaxID=2024840 RepID=UPI003A93D6BA
MRKSYVLMWVLGWCLHSPVAAAYDCYQPSPTVESLEEEYRNNDKSLVIDKNEEALQFLKQLKGQWTGTGEEISCKGSDNNPQKLHKQMQVEADVEESSIVLFKARLEKVLPAERVSRSETLGLINIESLYGLSANGRHIEANQREFASNGPNAGVRYLEYMITIDAPNDDELYVEWSLFTNGVYVFTQKLNLTRN